jgi:superfamily II DNA or RNA helicase
LVTKSKTIHQIGQELHAKLRNCPNGELVLGYAEYRNRFRIARRDTKKLNRLREVLASDCKVLVYPEVDGRLKRRAKQPWSQFKDKSTRVVCRLRGAGPPQRSSVNEVNEVNADADLWVTNDNVMQVVVARGKRRHPLYEHQKEAVKRMTVKMKAKFAGVLVLPTGGGKTRAAVHWLLSNVVDKGGKVLWLAHRYSLIDQACNEFCRTAYSGDVLHAKERFICRKVSGRHARPIDIRADDDVVIGSVFSLGRSSGPKYLRDNWLADDRPICLVVDEAHHAPAPTYRKVIEAVRSQHPDVRVLGLTATPYRTAKGEQGLMKKMFPGDIIHKVDLQELVTKDILAEPHFEEVETDVNFQLTDAELNKLIRTGGDFGKLGGDICRTLGPNSKRNQLIVDRYVKERKRYGRTLIFALNIVNAIALTTLLKRKGVAAGYVVSSLYDVDHNVNISAKENEKTIKDFRNGKLDVLVNVNILTEGFDDPSIQTVFLARPTMSTIMMMQMVGRALRGPKVAGGTKTANIVSFIDDWAEKIRWKSPNELMARKEAEFADTLETGRKAVLKLISIRLIEEYATFLDSELGPNVFGDVPFARRIPVGVYVVSTFDESTEDGEEGYVLDQTADILVFEDAKTAFDKLLKELRKDAKAGRVPNPGTKGFEQSVDRMMKKHFADIAGLPFSPRREEIRTMLGHMAKHSDPPRLIKFDQRNAYDIDKIAKHVYGQDMGPKATISHLKELWGTDQTGWNVFFGGDFPCFARAVQETVDRLAIGGLGPVTAPTAIPGKKLVEDCSMAELYEKQSKKWKELRDAVYRAAYDQTTRKYRCAATGWQSKYQNDFQIDHIRPRSAGGKTALDNLRLLRRRENAKKGPKWEES